MLLMFVDKGMFVAKTTDHFYGVNRAASGDNVEGEFRFHHGRGTTDSSLAKLTGALPK